MDEKGKILLDLMRVVADMRKSRGHITSYPVTYDGHVVAEADDDDIITLTYKNGLIRIPYCTADDESEEGLNQWQEQALKSAEWGSAKATERFIEGKPTFDIIAKGYPSLHAYSIVLFNNGVIDIELRKRK